MVLGELMQVMRGYLGAALAAAVLAVSAVAMAQAPPRMTQAEGLEILQVAGFKLVGGRALNTCGTPSAPKFTYLDLNGDGVAEAIAVDKNPACYGGAGDRFAVLSKGRDGYWRAMLREPGTIRWETTRTNGWLDGRVEAQCPRMLRYSGTAYELSSCLKPAGGAASPPPAKPADRGLTAADRVAAMRVAGMVLKGGTWLGGDGECEASIGPEGVRDLNGDGRPELMITEVGSYCYGNTGEGFYLTEKTPAGVWRVVYSSRGIPTVLAAKGAGGWPDIEVGGPGFCFPIVRYNGKTYVFSRNREEQPGACRPRR